MSNTAHAIMTEAFLLACEDAGLTAAEDGAFRVWLRDVKWKDGITLDEWERQILGASSVLAEFRALKPREVA